MAIYKYIVSYSGARKCSTHVQPEAVADKLVNEGVQKVDALVAAEGNRPVIACLSGRQAYQEVFVCMGGGGCGGVGVGWGGVHEEQAMMRPAKG